MVSLSQLTQDVLSLPAEDRIRLAQVLWNSVPPEDQAAHLPLSDEFLEELDRRNADLESGRVEAIPYEKAMAELRKSLK